MSVSVGEAFDIVCIVLEVCDELLDGLFKTVVTIRGDGNADCESCSAPPLMPMMMPQGGDPLSTWRTATNVEYDV